MDWYSTIKRMYDRRLWTKQMVSNGVFAGKISEEQYQQITGEAYQTPEVAPFSVEEAT